MIAGHTAAPWGVGIPYRDSITGFWQCLITRNGVAFITVGGTTKEECVANARLVATAPAMLDALKAAKKSAVFGYSHVEKQVDAVIAEATGKGAA